MTQRPAVDGPVSEMLARALGEEDELRWWEARVEQAVRRQGLRLG